MQVKVYAGIFFDLREVQTKEPFAHPQDLKRKTKNKIKFSVLIKRGFDWTSGIMVTIMAIENIHWER